MISMWCEIRFKLIYFPDLITEFYLWTTLVQSVGYHYTRFEQHLSDSLGMKTNNLSKTSTILKLVMTLDEPEFLSDMLVGSFKNEVRCH